MISVKRMRIRRQRQEAKLSLGQPTVLPHI